MYAVVKLDNQISLSESIKKDWTRLNNQTNKKIEIADNIPSTAYFHYGWQVIF